MFQQKIMNTIRVSNGEDPDPDRRSVGPDLGPYCLQRRSTDDENSPLARMASWARNFNMLYLMLNKLPGSMWYLWSKIPL